MIYQRFIYTAEDNHKGTTFTFEKNIWHGNDILGAGYDHLRDLLFEERTENINEKDFGDVVTECIKNGYISEEMSRSITDVLELVEALVPLCVVYDRYVITKIQETEICEGCRYISPGQLDHMSCPNGCLHEKSSCDWC